MVKVHDTQTPVNTLLGRELVKPDGSVVDTDEILKGTKWTAVLFATSAQQAEVEKLNQFYQSQKKSGALEIVLVSSDVHIKESIQFLSMPDTPDSFVYKTSLSKALHIHKLPTLVLLETKTGNYVTNKAMDHVLAASADSSSISDADRAAGKKKSSASAASSVVKEWKAMPAVPISDAGLQLEAFQEVGVLGTIQRNPLILIAILYGLKYGMPILKSYIEQLQQKSGGEEL